MLIYLFFNCTSLLVGTRSVAQDYFKYICNADPFFQMNLGLEAPLPSAEYTPITFNFENTSNANPYYLICASLEPKKKEKNASNFDDKRLPHKLRSFFSLFTIDFDPVHQATS